MVRAGVVNHPAEWEMSGYNEIQNPPDRYGVIELQALQQLCGFSNSDQFAEQHSRWVHDAIAGGRIQRERCWTESVAVGSLKFIEETKARLGIKAKGRKIKEQQEESFMLREESAPYNAVFATEIEALRAENAFFWEDPLIDLDG